jgi:tRNA(fMet)-specific endonuclease VapC
MILLDTDVLSLVQRDDSPPGLRVRARIAELPDTELVAITIITYHEQTSGWLAYLAKARTKPQQIYAYSLLERHLEDYRKTRVVPYDGTAANIFDQIRSRHPRMGTMDLRIAAIVLSHEALLVTRNIHDFSKIADVRVEDWTKP